MLVVAINVFYVFNYHLDFVIIFFLFLKELFRLTKAVYSKKCIFVKYCYNSMVFYFFVYFKI